MPPRICSATFSTPSPLVYHIKKAHLLPAVTLYKCTHCSQEHIAEELARACIQVHLSTLTDALGTPPVSDPPTLKSDANFWPQELRLPNDKSFLRKNRKSNSSAHVSGASPLSARSNTVAPLPRAASAVASHPRALLPEDFDSRVVREIDSAIP